MPKHIDTLQNPPPKKCKITLPPSLTKNGREHTFPIGVLSARVLQSCITPNSPASTLIFAGRGKTTTPFNGWSKAKAALDELSGVYDWTLHDLRRTFATRLAEMGTAPHVIERLLNHITGSLSPIALVYNKAAYLEEMARAVNNWQAFLEVNVIQSKSIS